VLHRRLGTGIEVCGIPFRSGSLPDACKANAVSFTKPLNPITKDSASAGKIVEGTECDHALELQALKFAMDQSGACRAMDAIIKASRVTTPSSAQQKTTLLQNMFNAINGASNAFSLDEGVNGAKALVVAAGLKDGGSCTVSSNQTPENLKAVNAYFTDTSVNGPTTQLAAQLDNLASTAVNNAETSALAKIGCDPAGSTRQRTINDQAKADVATGKALYTGTTAMTNAWNGVLQCAAHVGA